MGYIATWGPKGFIASLQKIVPLEGLTTTVALKQDNEKDTSGTAPTNTKGKELQAVSFSTTYFRGAGVDPRAQWEEWCTLVGEAYPLYLGEERFGPQKLILKSASLAEAKTDNQGRMIIARVSLAFEEYSEAINNLKKTTSQNTTATYTQTKDQTSAQRAAAVYAETLAKNAAMSVGASTSDKATKKSVGVASSATNKEVKKKVVSK